MQTVQREPPEALRPEDVTGLEAQNELLELVQQVQRRHRPRQCPRGRAVDSSDSRPQRTDAQALQEAELEKHAVHATTGEHDRDVPLAHILIVVLLLGPRHPHPSNLPGWKSTTRGI